MANTSFFVLPRTRSFLIGAILPVRSFQLIVMQRSLVLWSLLPVLITFLLYIFLIRYLQQQALQVVGNFLLTHGFNSGGWLYLIARIFSFLAIFIVSALTFSFVATIAASPFNDFLAERAEAFASPKLSPVGHQALALKVRLLVIDILKSVCATAAGLCALLLSWLPGVNLVAFALSFLLVTFQFISYPQTRRGEGIAQGAAFLRRHLFACLGFGLTMSFLLAIPLLSCLATPVAVVGGTLLVARAPGDDDLPALK